MGRIGDGTAAAGRVTRAVLRALVDYALPPRCPGCGLIVREMHAFCLDCWGQLEFLGGSACTRCGDPFEVEQAPGACCTPCRVTPPACDAVLAAVRYGPIARRLALKLKYGGRIGLAVTMARAMRRRLPVGSAGMIVVPVPLHRWRLWRRGFNQAALIGRAVARGGGARVAEDALRRTRATPLLRGLGPDARARTVRDAFALAPGAAAMLAGARVLLIDDVYTTGATANACARILKDAGAAEVRLLCWARVVKRPDPLGDETPRC